MKEYVECVDFTLMNKYVDFNSPLLIYFGKITCLGKAHRGQNEE